MNPWLAALGYFACYVPYAAVTKWLSLGGGPGHADAIAVLPLATLASVVTAAGFLAATGWWRAARWRDTPWRQARWTVLSGLCSSAIIATTTLAYGVAGSSVLLMVLLLRGGVLVLAPIVDAISGTRIHAPSWLALAGSLAGVGLAALGGHGHALGPAAVVDVAVYLAAYFVRLRLMSRLAKARDPDTTRRYFVQEQMVASPALLVALASYAVLGDGAVAHRLADGFTGAAVPPGWALLAGVCSQGTGVFGALVLLSPREHTFAVPLNRGASILAGVVAELGLRAAGLTVSFRGVELAGAALVIVAIAVLALDGLARRLRDLRACRTSSSRTRAPTVRPAASPKPSPRS